MSYNTQYPSETRNVPIGLSGQFNDLSLEGKSFEAKEKARLDEPIFGKAEPTVGLTSGGWYAEDKKALLDADLTKKPVEPVWAVDGSDLTKKPVEPVWAVDGSDAHQRGYEAGWKASEKLTDKTIEAVNVAQQKKEDVKDSAKATGAQIQQGVIQKKEEIKDSAKETAAVAQNKVEEWRQSGAATVEDAKQQTYQTAAAAQNKVEEWKQSGAETVRQTAAAAQNKVEEWRQSGAETIQGAKLQTVQAVGSLEKSGEESRLGAQETVALSTATTAERVSAKMHEMRPDETSTQNKSLPARAADVALGAASAVAGAAKAVVNSVAGALNSSPAAEPTNDMQQSTYVSTANKLDNAGNKIDDLGNKAKYSALETKEEAKDKLAETQVQAESMAAKVGHAIVNAATSLENRLEARGECARLGSQERIADAGEAVALREGESKLTMKAQEARPSAADWSEKSVPMRAVDTVIGAGAMVVDAAKAVSGAVAGAVDQVRHRNDLASSDVPNSTLSSSTTSWSAPSTVPLGAGDKVVIEKETVTKQF